MLLHWLGYRSCPFTGTGSNGEPVATMARPSDQAYASAAVSSADDVGFDNGKIIGVSTCRHMLRIAASEIVPLRPLTPRIRSGFTSPIVASSVPPSAMSLRANAACSSVSGVDPSLAKSFHGSRSRPSSPSWS